MRDERVPLGVVRLNLSEFVEESDAITSRKRSASLGAAAGAHLGGGAAGVAMGSPPVPRVHGGEETAEDGIVRRYLMQESKVNSTLQVGILMVQIDGDRNYVAPPLRTAPVFGGIAGFMAGEQAEQEDIAGRKSPRDDPCHSTGQLTNRRDPQHLQVPRRRRAPRPLSQRPDSNLVRPARRTPRLRRSRRHLLRRQRLGHFLIFLPPRQVLGALPRRRGVQRQPLGRRGLRRDAAALGL